MHLSMAHCSSSDGILSLFRVRMDSDAVWKESDFIRNLIVGLLTESSVATLPSRMFLDAASSPPA
jgi:hypothetical protein